MSRKGQGLVYALSIGISYPGTPYELKGCHQDVGAWKQYLLSRGHSDITILDDTQFGKNSAGYPSRKNIFNSIQSIIRRMKAGDAFFMHFSGHGFHVQENGSLFTNAGAKIDEDAQECLLLRHTASTPNNQISIHNTSCDVEIIQLLHTIPKQCKALVVVDACSAGSMFDQAVNLQVKQPNNRREAEFSRFYSRTLTQTQTHVVVFTAVRKHRFTWDVTEDNLSFGIFSKYFIDILSKRPNSSYLDMLHSLQNMFDQRKNTQDPMLSVSNDQNISSRIWL